MIGVVVWAGVLRMYRGEDLADDIPSSMKIAVSGFTVMSQVPL